MSFLLPIRCGSVFRALHSLMPKVLGTEHLKNNTVRNIHNFCSKQNLSLVPNTLRCSNSSWFLQSCSPILNMICGMKVKGRLQLRCRNCYYVARRERLYVMCKTHPRHKQTQMKKRDYKTWILTSASQSPKRPW